MMHGNMSQKKKHNSSHSLKCISPLSL